MFMQESLAELKTVLSQRSLALGTPEHRRRKLDQIGQWHRVSPAVVEGQTWGAVDGSWISLGSSFPYIIEVYRALARTTRGAEVKKERMFCPLRKSDMDMFKASGAKGPKDLSDFRSAQITKMEVTAGLELIRKERPNLLLLDGGLLPIESHAPEAWQMLCREADRSGTILVGVIEDIESDALAGMIDLECDAGDAEVLDGVLGIGEAFLPDKSLVIKSERLAVAFVRYASEPRPIGIDVRVQDADKLPLVLDLIGTVTPKHGRGIPLWLDVIDRDVRLNSSQVEQWLRAGLGSLYDAILVPHRRRRQY